MLCQIFKEGTPIWTLQVSLIVLFMSCRGILAALPAGFTVTATTDSLSVAWTSPGTGDVPATFNVDVSEGTTSKATCTSDDGSCQVSSGLSAGTGYQIKVTDSDASTDYINTYYTVPLATTPVLGASTPDDPSSQLHVSWSVTSGNPTSGLIYMVQLGSDTPVAATSPTILESLSPGTQYTVMLWSVAGQGTTGSATSATSQASGYTTPKALTSVDLIPGSDSSKLQVTWASPADNGNDVTYTAELRTILSGSETVTETKTSATSPVEFDTTLTPGTQYTVYVKAVVGGLESGETQDSSYTAPKAPTAVVLSPGSDSNKLQVTWVSPTDNGGDVTYTAVLRTGTSGSGSVKDTQTSATSPAEFDTLTPGTQYTVYVKAVVGVLESGEAQDSSYTAPNAPTAVVLSRGSDSSKLQVTWVSDNGGDVTYTAVLRTGTSGSGSVKETKTSATSPAEFDTLTPGTQYTVYVKAVVSGLESGESQDSSYTVPKPPTGIGLVKSGTSPSTSLVASWTETGDNAGTVKYRVRLDRVLSLQETGTDTDASSPGSHTFNDLVPGAVYKVYVWAEAGSIPGNGQKSMVADSGASNVYTKPLELTDLKLVRNPGNAQRELKLTWTRPTNNDGNVIYKATIEADGVTSTLDSSGTKLYSGRSPATSYTVKVWSQVTDSEKSDEQSLSLYTAPDKPDGLSVSPTDTKTIEVSWTAVTGLEYDVTISKDGMTSNKKTPCMSQSSSPCTIDVQEQYSSSELPGQKYWVNVEAKVTAEPAAKSGQTTDIAINTKPSRPNAPTKSSSTTSSLTVSWTMPANSGQYDKFIVSIPSQDDIETAKKEYSFSGLTAGTLYNVQVVSVVGANNIQSDKSTAGQLYTKPNPPSTVRVTSQLTDSITIQWDTPAGVVSRYKTILSSASAVDNGLNKIKTFDGLTPGTEYTIKVFSEAEDGTASDYVTNTYYTAPDRPRDLLESTTVRTTDTVGVTWSAPATGSHGGYSISINAAGLTDKTLLSSDISETFSPVLPGAVYTVKLKSTLQGLSSSELSQTVTAKPNPPRSLQLKSGSISTNTVTFQWLAPDQAASVTNYKYKVQKTGSTNIIEGTTTSLEKTVGGLEPGATYSISIQATKNDASSSFTVLNDVTLVPNKPRNLRENSNNKATTSIEVQWDSPGSGVHSNYYIKWSKDGNKVGDASPTQSVQAISGLQPGQTYTVTVYAESNGVRSAAESGTFSTSLDAAKPGFMNKTTRTLTISWGDPANTDVSHYIVYTTPDGGEQATQYKVETSTDKTYSYQFTGLIPGETYTSTVVVHSTGGQTQSADRTDTTIPLNVVTFNAATTATQSAGISWTVNPDSKQAGFEVTYGSGGNKDIAAASGQTSYTDNISGLSPGLTYSFSIKAYSRDNQNNKVFSETAKTEAETTRPLPVTGFVATRSPQSMTSVELNWSPGHNSNQDDYTITYTGEIVKKTTQTITAVESPNVVSGLFPGERYKFIIKAKSSDKLSDPQDSTVAVYPLPPKAVEVSPTRGNETQSFPIIWTYDSSVSYNNKWRVNYTSPGVADEYTVGTTDNGDNDRQITVTGLTPGQSYTIKVYGLTVGDLTSQTATTLSVTAKPDLGSATLSKASTMTTLTVTYTVPGGSGVFDGYVFSISPGSNDNKEKTKDDTDRHVEFYGLVPGTVYTVDMWLKSSNEISLPLSTRILTKPAAPTVDCGELGENSFEIVITAPSSGLVDKYSVSCPLCGVDREIDKNSTGSDTKHRISGLLPFRDYSYEVQSIRRDFNNGLEEVSIVTSGSCKTSKGPAGAVKTFIAIDVKPYELTLEWGDPSADNGVIVGYTIGYSATKAKTNPILLKTKIIDDPTTRSTTITGLKAGFKYVFYIFARNGLDGDRKYLTVTPPIMPPALGPDYNIAPTLDRINDQDPTQHNKVTLKFTNPFTDVNGDVVSYSIIVANADRRNPELDENVVDSWQTAYKQNPAPPYVAIWCETFKDLNSCGNQVTTGSARRKRAAAGDIVTVVIGGDLSCDSNNFQRGTYCNGPLRSKTSYNISIRGHNEINEYTRGPWVIVITAKEPLVIAVIIAPIIVVLLAVAVVVILLVLWRRGVIFNRKEGSEPMKPFGIKIKPKVSRIIKIEDFVPHYKDMSADSDFKFAEEYEDLKSVGKDQAFDMSTLPANRLKNRFVNILPYDHSRVKLLPTDDEGEGASDYINANWMPGYNSKREFMVCQGPLPGTRDDHWRMIWEYNCRAIVMLTKCVENGREKCDHYWPYDSEPMYYGDLQVQITGETKDLQNPEMEYIMSDLQISQGEQTRRLTHYHFLVWPDFGVPAKPKSLVSFVKKVRSMLSYEGGPIVVHCSAGVGRSGTYIALDRLLQTIEEHDAVDIYGIVHEMRLARPFMVQTEKQYIFLHECLKFEIEDSKGAKNIGYDEDEDGTENLYVNVIRG